MVFSTVITAAKTQQAGLNVPPSATILEPIPRHCYLADLEPVATSFHSLAAEFIDNILRRSHRLQAVSEPFVSAGQALHSNDVLTFGGERNS